MFAAVIIYGFYNPRVNFDCLLTIKRLASDVPLIALRFFVIKSITLSGLFEFLISIEGYRLLRLYFEV